ncbi:MAG: sensor histidine kinase [Fimbriimonadales bacterium]|nr:sensor histidine kinase [Fimbriimonadales bacterium]
MAALPEYRRFTRVNLPVWAIVGATVVWAVIQKLTDKFTLAWPLLAALIGLAVVSVTLRTVVGLKSPHRIYQMTLPLVVLDLLLITLGVGLTGGFQSQVWLLYFALLVSEAAVMSTRGLLLALAFTAIGYGFASAPLPPEHWNDFWYRVAVLSLVAWLIHQVYRSHAEHRLELAELREQYELAQERERIAREFHDGLGHHLVSAIRGLESLQRSAGRNPNSNLHDALQEQVDILRTALDETRQTIQQLRAPETTDMRAFIKQSAERVAQRLGAQLHCECPETMPELTPLQSLMLTRVVQEALSNVMKHAGNPQNLYVECRVDGDWLEARVADDGNGFDPETVLEGVGLSSMRDRIHTLGGEIALKSAPGQGTTVHVRVPIRGELWKS